jgi:hypothetical protein
MSTKTTFKRVALVAAVAAAFGGLSTVAANATVSSSTLVVASTYGTGSGTAAGTQVVGGLINVTLTETTTATAGLVGTLSSTGVGSISAVTGSSHVTAQSGTVYPTLSVNLNSDSTGDASGTAVTITLTSAVAGTQTLAFTPIASTGAPGTAQTVTITWGAAPVASASYSVVSIKTGTTSTTLGTATSSTDALSAPNTAATAAGAQAAKIGVEVESAATTLLAGQGISASVTGPGLLSLPVDESANTAVGLSSAAVGRSVSLAASGSHGYAAIALFADGTAGTSTVTVSTAAGVVLGTVSFTFTGSAAKVSATQNLKVLKAGGTAGNAATNVYAGTTSVYSATTVLTQATTTVANYGTDETNATTSGFTAGKSPITATTTDALGNPVALASAGPISSSVIKVVVSDPTILTAGSCYAVAASTTASATATNEINCAVSGTTGATSGASATATVELYNTKTQAWDILAAPLTFTIGGSVVAETAALDAATYAPGQPLALSIKATDKAGNAAYDQDIAGLITAVPSTYIQGFATPTKLIGGVATKTVAGYAPSQDGTFTITGVDGDSGAGEALSVTASVTTGAATASAAATDAANEATDAANAATDAANAAADAADAATSAAQDASAKADAALAAVNALSAKITVLAAQIAKIVKKLGA